MAGRPLRRARLAAAAAAAAGIEPASGPPKPAPQPPRLSKPVAEMSREEMRECASQLRREIREVMQPLRDAQLRQGRRMPRNNREREIFAADLINRRRVAGDTEPRKTMTTGTSSWHRNNYSMA